MRDPIIPAKNDSPNNNHLMGVSGRRADRKSSPATDFLSEVGWTVPRNNTGLFFYPVISKL